MRSQRASGYTLIELLVVVAILGIIVAIAVINYRNAIDRGRQRRTMADMRNVSTAMEAYASDFDRYPPAAAFSFPAGLDLPSTPVTPARPYLEPTYLRVMPVADGWNSWFLYGTTASRSDYALRSAGLEGVPESSPAYGPTSDFRNDIILVNGQFVQWPDGFQR